MPVDLERTREVLKSAIEARRPVVMEYRYPGQGRRTVHPHVLYRSPAGTAYLDAYQVDGYTSERQSLPGWRAFDVAQVISADLLDGRYEIAPGYNAAAEKYRGGIDAAA